MDSNSSVGLEPPQLTTSGTPSRSVFAILPGLGDSELPGFPTHECPEEVPDLKDHRSIAAEVIKSNPSLYTTLRGLCTGLGVSFAKCIKPAVDCPSSKEICTVAGDVECYTLFRDFFDAVICRATGASDLSMAPILGSSDASSMSQMNMNLDPSSKYVLSISIRGDRNISGFRFAAACSEAEREQIEAIIVGAMDKLQEEADFEGSYNPLPHSGTFKAKPAGISLEDAQRLASKGMLFHEPTSHAKLSAGIGRHWPHARGVFMATSERLVLWVNEEDHLSLFSLQDDGNLQEAFARFSTAMRRFEDSLRKVGHAFASNERLGYLTSCPGNVGIGLHVSIRLRLPLLSSHAEFHQDIKGLGVKAANVGGDVWEVSTLNSISQTDVQYLNSFAKSCRYLVEKETGLDLRIREASDAAQVQKQSVFAVLPGLGDTAYPGFPTDACPETAPDLERHRSIAATVLRNDASLYKILQKRRTSLDVSFARCIKPCIDNPLDAGIGAVAGDAESYTVFRNFFDPLVCKVIGREDVRTKRKPSKTTLSQTAIDPSGRHVHSICIRGDRNIEQFRFPTSCGRDERREVEAILVKSFDELHANAALDGTVRKEDLSGSYHTCPNAPGALERQMRPEHAELLRSKGMLFHEPSLRAKLSAGIGRHWPDARGVYVATSERLVIWVNEEDHLSVFSLQPDGNLQEAFARFSEAMQRIEKGLGKGGHRFAYNDRLGYLTSCPSNIGSGLHVSIRLRLQNLTLLHESICERSGLRATLMKDISSSNAVSGRLLCEVTCSDRFGQTDIDCLNCLLNGCRQLVEEELHCDVPAQPHTQIKKPNSMASSGHQPLEKLGAVDSQGLQENSGAQAGARNVFAVLPGLGDREFPGFPTDICPAEIPDLTKHRSIAAAVLRSSPSLYMSLRDDRTSLGVPFARCIKPCVDCPQEAGFGAVAGDAECYTAFKDFFDAAFAQTDGGQSATSKWEPHAGNIACFSKTPIDASGKHVLSICLRGDRNISRFRFPTACSKEERSEIEAIITKCLDEMSAHDCPAEHCVPKDELLGSYHSFSKAAAAKSGGQRKEIELLHAKGMLFQEPKSHFKLSAGIGRHWPDARGVFVAVSERIVVWVNGEDHLSVFSMQPDGNLQEAFSRFSDVMLRLERGLDRVGHAFAFNDRLGYLTSDPRNVGSGLHVSIRLRLPMVSRRPDFQQECIRLGLEITNAGDDMWVATRSNTRRQTAIESLNALADSCGQLVGQELAGNTKSLQESNAAQSFKQNVEGTPKEEQRGVFAVLPGLGDRDVPGFSADACPDKIPDLVGHRCIAAEVLRNNRSMYSLLKDCRTKLGVSFARCIKPCVDNPSAVGVGAIAGDAECYTLFRDFLEAVIMAIHGVSRLGSMRLLRDSHSAENSQTPIDPSGQHVLSVSIRGDRNINGFRFPPACDQVERKKVEEVLVKALGSLGKDCTRQMTQSHEEHLAGSYYPLANTATQKAAEILTMPEAMQKLFFQAPRSKMKLSSGIGRHWPEARGVFIAASERLFAWINEEDHLSMFSTESGCNLQAALFRFTTAMRHIEASLAQAGYHFAFSDHLGYLTSCPSNVCPSSHICVAMRLPYLSQELDIHGACKRLGLRASRINRSPSSWEISVHDNFGQTDVHLASLLTEGCRQLVALEKGQASSSPGQALRDDVSHLPEGSKVAQPQRSVFAILPGLGADPLPGFPVDYCPADLPFLARHRSLASEVLRRDTRIYMRLKDQSTSKGVTFAFCIKPGMDNPNSFCIGAVAGDEHCFSQFEDFFKPLISTIHGISPPGPLHPYDVSPSMVRGNTMDPSGQYAVRVRLETRRNLRGFRFAPSCSRSERMDIEAILVGALASIQDEGLRGAYYPLPNSTTYAPKPNGMTETDMSDLQKFSFAFYEPQSLVKLACGFGRSWPEARGVFASRSRLFAARINEEDHLRLIATQNGGDLQAAFKRFALALESLEGTLGSSNQCFARSTLLGYLTADPGNLGCGLQVAVVLRLPLLASKPEFEDICKKFGLDVRLISSATVYEHGDGGNVELRNSDSFSQPDVNVVNFVVDACSKLITMEVRLEAALEVPAGSGQRGARSLRASLSTGPRFDAKPKEVEENEQIRMIERFCDSQIDSAIRMGSSFAPEAGPHHRHIEKSWSTTPKVPQRPKGYRDNVSLLRLRN